MQDVETLLTAPSFSRFQRQPGNTAWKNAGLLNPAEGVSWYLDAENEYHQVAIISDLHFGNFFQQRTCLNNFISVCRERSIDVLMCCGDLTDGMMSWQGHEHERFLHSAYSFEEYCEDNFPSLGKMNGIISGNHDASLAKYENTSYDFCRHLSRLRKDLTYHKTDDVGVPKAFTLPGGIKLVMYHGSNCSNPMLGQKREPRLQQKTAEMLSEGTYGNIFIFGHCHKKCVTSFMDKYIIGVGCFIADTPYNIERGSNGDVGGLIVRYSGSKGKIDGLETEFIDADKLGGIRRRDF